MQPDQMLVQAPGLPQSQGLSDNWRGGSRSSPLQPIAMVPEGLQPTNNFTSLIHHCEPRQFLEQGQMPDPLWQTQPYDLHRPPCIDNSPQVANHQGPMPYSEWPHARDMVQHCFTESFPPSRLGFQNHDARPSRGAHVGQGHAGGLQAIDAHCPPPTVFIGGLYHLRITREEIRGMFQGLGEVVSANVDSKRGCAFVQFIRQDAAERAIWCMNDFEIRPGRRIRVEWSRQHSAQRH
jgi:hypothetical protein